MGKKISIDDTMDEIVKLQNQINGLTMLLNNKKEIMADFFRQSGRKSLDNEECIVYTQERTTVTYDIPKLIKKLGKDKAYRFIDRRYSIVNWEGFIDFCKRRGITGEQARQYVIIDKEVNKDKLGKAYEKGLLTLEDIEGCYEAKVTKSIALKLKNANTEINLT